MKDVKKTTTSIIIDRNHYNVTSYYVDKDSDKVILFPICHYQGDRQFYELIQQVALKGYKVITLNILNKGDRILFFDYYFTVFQLFYSYLVEKKIITNEDVSVLGYGPSALIAGYASHLGMPFKRAILISPTNRFKSDYSLSRNVSEFKLPTYIFYGQFDSVNSESSRFLVFSNGKNNPNVHFTCYSCTGYYLYYDWDVSLELATMYRNNNNNLLIGEDKKNATVLLPSQPKLNGLFFTHLFNVLCDKPNPKRIALLTDVFPLFVNGVEIVIELLQKELMKTGYEVYVVALWKKGTDYSLLPNPFYIPVNATFAHFIKDHKTLMMLKSLDYAKNARMLSLFGFDYLHLHTEYSMSGTSLELAKITGIKMPYTQHTLWKQYYEHKFGKLIGDINYGTAKALLFNRVYSECPVIIVPGQKSYEILKKETKVKDIRIFPSPIDLDRFAFSKGDEEVVNKLKEQYNLTNKKVIGYVGRISPEKNILETIDYLSRISKEIPNLVFMIVGSGDAQEALKKSVKKYSLEDKVIFVGQIPNDQLKYYYRLFDAFVTASNFETQGLTYFEAAASETVIIAKEDKAIEGIFEDGVNAYIYKDFYQWVERIEQALFGKHNKELVKEAKKTLEKYNVQKWAKEMLSIYQELNKK